MRTAAGEGAEEDMEVEAGSEAAVALEGVIEEEEVMAVDGRSRISTLKLCLDSSEALGGFHNLVSNAERDTPKLIVQPLNSSLRLMMQNITDCCFNEMKPC